MPRGEKVCAFIEAYCNNNWQGAENAPRNRCRRIDICACELVPARRNSGVLGPLLDTLGHLLFCRFSIDRCSNLPSRKHYPINTVWENHQMTRGERVVPSLRRIAKSQRVPRSTNPFSWWSFRSSSFCMSMITHLELPFYFCVLPERTANPYWLQRVFWL